MSQNQNQPPPDVWPCGTPKTGDMCPKHGQAFGCELAVKEAARKRDAAQGVGVEEAKK